MKAKMKAADMLSDTIIALEEKNAAQITIERVQDIILELKTIKATEIKERVQYWQQVKDEIINTIK